jgi:tetratricopeptide (TPR) repeat protein
MRLALARHDAIIEEVVAEHCGTVVRPRGEGDSRFAVFSRATDGVVAACAIQRALSREPWPTPRPLLVRIAVHTGDTELRNGDYYGTEINRCARLRNLAYGGQLLISGVTARLVGGSLAPPIGLQDLGLYRLRGLREPEHVFQLLHPDLAGDFPPLGDQARPRVRRDFVGRAKDLSAVSDVLDAALAGHTHLVLVSGEPGIGKTRFTEELVTRAAPLGFTASWGQCRVEEGAPPFWPWVQIVRALRGHGAAGAPRSLTSLLDLEVEPTERFQLFESVAYFLEEAASNHPRIVILDDLQWADEASLGLLRFVIRQLRTASILFVCLYRDVEIGVGDPVMELISDLAGQATQIQLRGLDRPEVDRLVRILMKRNASSEVVELVTTRTGGNPLFIRELIKLLRRGRDVDPANELRNVIAHRLRLLSQSCLESLRTAAVIGLDFRADLLASVIESDLRDVLDRLDEAVRAGIVYEQRAVPATYQFLHAVVRDVLYAGLSTASRAEYQRRIGEALESRAGTNLDDWSPQLAYRFQQALEGNSDDALIRKAIDYTARAAEQAHATAAYDEAVAHLDQAVDLLRDYELQPQTVRGDLLLRLGRTHLARADRAAARAAYTEAATLARKLGSSELLARAALGYALDFASGADPTPAPGWIQIRDEIRMLEEALQALGESDQPLRASLMARLAVVLLFAPGAAHRRADLADSAVALARRIDDASTLAQVLCADHAIAWGLPNAEERLALSSEVVELALKAGDRSLALQGRALRLGDLMELGDIHGFRNELEVLEQSAIDLRQIQYLWYGPLLRATLATLEGNFAQAEDLARRGLELGQRVQHPGPVVAYPALGGSIRLAQGRFGELTEELGKAVRRFPHFRGWHAALAFALCEAGMPDDARVEFERLAVDDFAGLQGDFSWCSAIALLALTTCWLGDATRAARLDVLLRPFASKVIRTTRIGAICLGAAEYFLGLLRLTMEDFESAVHDLQNALETHERLGAAPLVAHTRYQYAIALRERGIGHDQTLADREIAQAVTDADALGIRLNRLGRL